MLNVKNFVFLNNQWGTWGHGFWARLDLQSVFYWSQASRFCALDASKRILKAQRNLLETLARGLGKGQLQGPPRSRRCPHEPAEHTG